MPSLRPSEAPISTPLSRSMATIWAPPQGSSRCRTRCPSAFNPATVAAGTDWRQSPRLATVQAEVTRELDGQGRVLIRPSGTEPVVRVMVEAREAEAGQRCAQRLVDALR